MLYKITIAIVCFIFLGISFHAPVTVFFETYFHTPDVVKAWKEILMGIATVLLVVFVYRKNIIGQLLRDRIVQVSLIFLLFHLGVLLFIPTTSQQMQAGILIDTRYTLFFLIVYVLAVVSKIKVRDIFLKTIVFAASIVILFGVLQITVLPRDILSAIGYSPETIRPYLTVDQNPDYTRINSTLRGPNPLGIYAASILAIVVAYSVRHKKETLLRKQKMILPLCLGAASIFVLWHTYARSALIASVVAVTTVVMILLSKKIHPIKLVAAGSIGALLLFCVVMIFSHTPFVQQVIFHTDMAEGNAINSDQQHLSSLTGAVSAVAQNPFGYGVGSTGSASLYGDKPLIIESQYLFVAHEIGIIGLIIFLILWGAVLYRLWIYREQYLALGLFASGIGIAVAALVLPVWVDDTVSILWWGLAAMAISGLQKKGMK